MRTLRLPTGLVPLGIFLLALAFRLIALGQVWDVPTMHVPLSDSRSYFEWSARIAAGQWWRGEVFYQAPLYPYFLAAVRFLGGDPLVTIRLVQAVLGAVSCVLLWQAATWIAGGVVGAVAGLLLAVNAPGIYFGILIQKTVLDTLLLTAMLACLAAGQLAPRARTWLAAGLLLGLLCLSRENALLLIVTLPLWMALALRDHPWRRRRAGIAALLLGVAMALVPVALRNAAMGGGFVLTTSQLGPNLFIGNNPKANGVYVPLRPGREDPAFERTDATEIAEAARGRRLSPPAVSGYWIERTWELVRAQPAAWARLTLRKLLLLLNATEAVDVEDYYVYLESSGLLRVLDAISHFGIVLALAAAGVWVTRRRRVRFSAPLVVALSLLASMVPFFFFGRYRFTLVPPLLVLGAAALVQAAETLRRRDVGALVTPAALGVLALGLTQLPVVSRSDQRAAAEVNLAIAAARLGHLDEGLRYLDDAIRRAPEILQAHFQRGVLLARAGRTEEARQSLERVLRMDPTNVEATSELGALLVDEGRLAEAAALFRRLVFAEPRRADARTSLAVILGGLGRHDEAMEECRQAIALDPKSGRAHGVLGWLELAAGDSAVAITHLRRATELDPGQGDAHLNLAQALAASGGDANEVERELRLALASNPAPARAHDELVRVLVRRGDGAAVVEALDAARRAGRANGDAYFRAGRDLRLAGHDAAAINVLAAGRAQYPQHLGLTNALAWYLATVPDAALRNPGRALALAAEAARLAPGRPPYVLDTEAAALAAAGRHAEAAQIADSASALARSQRDPKLAEEIASRARLYRAGTSYVEAP